MNHLVYEMSDIIEKCPSHGDIFPFFVLSGQKSKFHRHLIYSVLN